MSRARLSMCLGLLLVFASCSGGVETSFPKTSRVSGQLLVNGKPAPKGEIELKLYPKGQEVSPGDVIANCIVGDNGRFEFSSYTQGDGAVPGDYVLSVEWLRPAPGVLYGPDKFLNNFNSPDNSDPRFQVTVVEGQPVEIPVIDIDTSQLKQKPMHPFATPAGKKGR